MSWIIWEAQLSKTCVLVFCFHADLQIFPNKDHLDMFFPLFQRQFTIKWLNQSQDVALCELVSINQTMNREASSLTEKRPHLCFTYQRTLSQVWVAPNGDPDTMGTWMVDWFFPITVSSFSTKPRQVASRTCSFASMLSRRWQIAWLMDTSIDWKQTVREIQK